MRRKHFISVLMLSMGVALLVAAMVASSAMSATRSAKAGGTLHVGLFGGSVTFLDPQLAYDTGSWTVLENTEVTLVRYADSNGAHAPLHLEGATSFPSITGSGKIYTWHIKAGFKFNDGTPVTAASYQRAFERLLSPCMYEGGIGTADFFDKTIVGGVAFNTGACSPHGHIAGVQASGNTLTIHLNSPAAYFTSAMAMIWFSAMKPDTPMDTNHQDNGAEVSYPSAGPYYVDSATPLGNVVLVLKKNPYYNCGACTRARNTNVIDFTQYGSQNGCYTDTKAGTIDVDMCGMKAADAGQAVSLYGAHTVTGVPGATPGASGRFHAEATDCVDYITLDTQRAPTNNVNARIALEWAISRTEILQVLGPFVGSLSDQILTPAVPGYQKYTVYPNTPNWNTAASKAAGSLNGKTLNLWHSPSAARTAQAGKIAAEINGMSSQFHMNIHVNQYIIDPTTYYTQLGNKHTATVGTSGQPGFNLARAGWCADYYDPFDYLNVLFDGKSIQPQGNNDLSYLNVPAYNSEVEAAAKLVGTARKQAYAKADKDLMVKYAPVVSYNLIGARTVTSARVGNWTYDEFQGSPALNALTVS